MQVLSIEFKTALENFEISELESKIYDLLAFLYDTRQITSKDYVLVRSGDRISVQITVPEPDALSRETTVYVRDAWRAVETAMGHKIEVKVVGTTIEHDERAPPAKSSYYILRAGWYSPLLCGDTHLPIPLYRIPPTDPDAQCYDNLRYWSNACSRLYGLWIGSGVGEDFAQRQMQEHDSELSRQGREVCRRIEALTGVPTYYFLLNYRDWSEEEDRARRCPETGRPWLIEGAKASDFIAFKSDAARLVSELSTNCQS